VNVSQCVRAYAHVNTLTKKRENPTGNPHHQWHSHTARVLQNSLRRDEYSRSNDRPDDDRDSSEQGHLLSQFHLLLGGSSVGVSIWFERAFLSIITWSRIPVGMGNWHSPSGHPVHSQTHWLSHSQCSVPPLTSSTW